MDKQRLLMYEFMWFLMVVLVILIWVCKLPCVLM